MKRIFLFIFCITITGFAFPSEETQIQLKKLDTQYPTLSDQVAISAANDILGINYDNAVNRLADYLDGANEDIRKGMAIVLQAGFFKAKSSPIPGIIVINGDPSEWIELGWGKTDASGNNPGKNPALDIVRVSAIVHAGVLYGIIETAKRPSYPNHVALFIDADNDSFYDYQFIANWRKDGSKAAWMNDFIKKENSKAFNENIVCDKAIEFAIPLEKYGMKTAEMPEIIKIGALTADGDFKNIEELDQIPVARVMENIPLTLLLYLMDKGVAPRGDTIPLALSLANCFLYSLSDKTVRALIAGDMVKHYGLYQKIVLWQKSWGSPYPLSGVPLIPKIFWADRSKTSQWDVWGAMYNFKKKFVTKEIYSEFIDDIGVLESIHKIVVNDNLARKDISLTAAILEEYVHKRRLYLNTMENMDRFNTWKTFTPDMLARAIKMKNEGKYKQYYFDKDRLWNDFKWVNYQYNYYLKEGIFYGDCVTTTAVQMAFYRMTGIAPASFQIWDCSGLDIYTHNFPAHYDPGLKRWRYYQIPSINPGGKYRGDIDVFLHYNKPYPHPWLYRPNRANVKNGKHEVVSDYYYPAELTILRKLLQFMKMGFSGKKMEELYLSDRTLEKGLFFDSDSAPDILIDSDLDGIFDPIEKEIGLNPAAWDSDGDLYSDLWELRNGQNPKKKDTGGLLAADGFSAEWQKMKNANSVTDPKGDSKVQENVFDISSFSLLAAEGNLYMSGTFHNDPAKNRIHNIEFWITAPGRFPSFYWFGGGYDTLWGNYASFPGTITIENSPGKYSNMPLSPDTRFVIGKDVEAVFPLSYIKDPVWIGVKFLMTSGPKGKEVQGAEDTDTIYLKLAEDSDNDSLSDVFEKKIGTDWTKWDTDGDLISDNWEYWHDMDPLSAKSPGKKASCIADGYADDIQAFQGSVTLNDPKDDTYVKGKGFDIASISACVSGGTLYVGIKFHGDNTGQVSSHYAIVIKADNKRDYWAGSGWDKVAGMDIDQALFITMNDGKGGNWPAIPKMDGAVLYAKRDAEFAIPVEYLGNAKSYKIRAEVTVKMAKDEYKWADDTGEVTLNL